LWRRQLLGEYAPQLEREPDGTIEMLQIPFRPSSTDAPEHR